MRQSIFLSVLGFSLALTACNHTIDTPNGSIPSEYLTRAHELEGTYQGRFNHRPGIFTLVLHDATPTLSFESQDGKGLLGAECAPEIGKLQQISASSEHMATATFAFRSGCDSVVGKELRIEFDKGSAANSMAVSVLKSIFYRHHAGDTDCSTDIDGTERCHHDGSSVVKSTYLSGGFTQISPAIALALSLGRPGPAPAHVTVFAQKASQRAPGSHLE